MRNFINRVFISISIPLLINPVAASAQDLNDIFKDALEDYLEEKAEEAGIDIPGRGTPKNVNLIFSGASTPSSDTFEALYSVDAPTTPTPATSSNETAAERDCFNRVQGRIAWNSAGSKQWSPQNVRKLCADVVVPSAPPLCFQNAMFRGTMWGKQAKHKMTWSLATQLCAKSNSPSTPISCLKKRLSSNYTLSNAVNACDANPRTIAVRPRPVARPVARPTSRLQQAECYNYVQGRIAWDAAKKNKKWNKKNVTRLCKGTTSKFSPGNCFSYAMHKGSQWGKRSKHVMSWSKAIDLCEGASNAKRTTTCFKKSIAAGKTVDQAVARCDR